MDHPFKRVVYYNSNMIQAPWQSTFSVSQSPILGLQSINKNLYVFQHSLISVYQSFNNLTTLIEQIHLLSSLRSYCVSDEFISIVTESAVEVRKRDRWEDVIYEMKSDGVKGIIIRDGSLIVEHVDKARTYLHFMNLTTKIQYEVELGPIFNQPQTKLESRLITINHIGKINDIYVYQSAEGTIESGIFFQLTNNKKKTYSVGTIQSLKEGKVRSLYRHSVEVEGMSYQTQLVILIVQWKEQKSIDLVVHEVLSSDQQLQKIEGSKPVFDNYEPFSELQDILSQFSLLDKEFDKEIYQQNGTPYKYIEHLIDNDVYEFSCQKDNFLWVSSLRSLLKIQLSKNITISSRFFVKNIQKWTKNLQFVGIHQNVPLFRDLTICVASMPVFKTKKTIQKYCDNFSTFQDKVSTYIQTQEVWVEDQEAQTQLTVPNILNQAQIQTSQCFTEQINVQTVKIQQFEFSTQTNQKKQASSQNQIIQQSDAETNPIITYNDAYTQICTRIQQQSYHDMNTQTENQKLVNDIQVQVQEYLNFGKDIQIQAQLQLKQNNRKVQVTESESQRNDFKLYKEVFECESQTQSKSSALQIKCSSIQQIIIRGRQQRKEICHWNMEPVQWVSQKSLQFGTDTEIELIGLDPYPDEQLKTMNELLNKFSQNTTQKLSKNINLLQEQNLKAKLEIQANLKQIAKQFGITEVGKQLETLLVPLVERSFNLLLSETKKIFQQGFIIFKQKTHELSAISQTFNKQYNQGVNIFDEVRKMVTEFGLVLKAKRINDLALYNSMQNQINVLKEQVSELMANLQQKLKDEKQLQLKIVKGFEEIQKITKIIEDIGDKSQDLSEEQQNQDQIQQQLPSVVGSLINSQSPSYYGNHYPNYSYVNLPMQQPMPQNIPMQQTSPYQLNPMPSFYPQQTYVNPQFQHSPNLIFPQPTYPPQPLLYPQMQSSLQTKPKNIKKKKPKNKQKQKQQDD